MHEKFNFKDKHKGRHTANKVNIARCTTFPSLCSLSMDNIRNFYYCEYIMSCFATIFKRTLVECVNV